MKSRLPALLLFVAALAAAGAHPAWAQEAGRSAAPEAEASASSVVLRAPGRAAAAEYAPVGVGDVGTELLSERALRTYRRKRAAAVRLQEQLRDQPRNEVTTEELTRGALIGGGIGLAAGAAVGALLGGGSNARLETALPGALAGLAVGAPVGVYLRTERAPAYLWGTASAVGAAGLIGVIFLAE